MTSFLNDLDEATRKQLEVLFSSKRLPHSIIVDGCDDKSKNSVISALAQYAVCKSETEKPCGVCSSCEKAAKSIHPDIITVVGSTASGIIGVDDIREINKGSVISPIESNTKVYIIKNSHLMNKQAQNALLKSLEEPVQNILYILESSNYNLILDTIKSRCTTLKINSDGQADIENKDELLKIVYLILDTIGKKSEFEILISLENIAKKTRAEIDFILTSLYSMLIELLKTNDKNKQIKMNNRYKLTAVSEISDIIFEAVGANKQNANINLLIAEISAAIGNVKSKYRN